eukprot:scaffold592773_cov28-Prasinocladus_malaysianus.AAC.1
MSISDCCRSLWPAGHSCISASQTVSKAVKAGLRAALLIAPAEMCSMCSTRAGDGAKGRPMLPNALAQWPWWGRKDSAAASTSAGGSTGCEADDAPSL